MTKSVIFSKNHTTNKVHVIHAVAQKAPQNHTVAIIFSRLRNRIRSRRNRLPSISMQWRLSRFMPDYPFRRRLNTNRKAVFSVGHIWMKSFATDSANQMDSISFWWSTIAEECHCGCTNCLSCPGSFASGRIPIRVLAFDRVSITETFHRYIEWRSFAHLFCASICLFTWTEGRIMFETLVVTYSIYE